MKKLFTSFSVAYALMISYAVAAEEYIHGDIALEVEQGIEQAEHASKGGLPQFDPTWFASQVFWLVISFAVLYMIFAKKTLPEISSVIENRKNHIDSDLETAEKLTSEADAVHDSYQASLTKARMDAADAIKTVENNTKMKANDAIESFRLKADKELKAAEKNIEASKDSALLEMNDVAARAAASAVEKIIGINPDKSKVQSIIKDMSVKAKAA